MKLAYLVLAAILSVQCSVLVAQSVHPVPFLDQPLIPISRAPGGLGFALTVNGANFVRDSVVMWDGRPRETHFVSSAQLRAKIDASDIARACTASITVANPRPGGGQSNVVFFPVRRSELPDSVGWKGVSSPAAQVIVAADFNRDGKLDLVTTQNYETEEVTVLIGNGDGDFQPPVSYSTNGSAGAIVVSDFNRDGNLDLIVGAKHLQELFGNGDGTFQSPKDLGFSGGALVAGDFNEDGNLDLAFTNNGLFVALGNGDGTFQPPVQVWSFSNVFTLAVGDFNGDGVLDIAAGNDQQADGSIAILLGNGDGTFQSPVSNAATFDTFYLVAADLNGDGKLDLVGGALLGTNYLSIYFGNGDGTFLPKVDYPLPGGAFGLAVGDFSADGKIDIAVADDHLFPPDYVSVLAGQGDGNFESPVNFLIPSIGLGRGVAAGFFNGRGNLDLAVATDNGVELLLQTSP